MANITSAGTGNSNDGATWTGGSVPTSSDNAIIQNGHTVTQNAAHTFKSLKVESGGAWTADGSNHLTLSGEDDNDFAFRIQGTYNHANGTVVINNGGGGIAHAAVQGGVATSTTGLYDLTISGGGTTCEIYGATTIHRNMEAGGATTVLRGALTVNGNLTVYGALTTIFSSTSHNLTVNGTTTIGLGSGAADVSTLTCNDSTVSLGALRQQADYAVNIEIGGTFVGGTGTHTFGSLFMAQSANAKATMTTGQVKVNGYNNSANKSWRVEYGGDTFDNADGTVMFQFNGFDSRMSMRGESHANNAFHNLIIHMNGDTRQISPDNGNKIIVDNDLTITRGKLVMSVNHALEVGGDCVIDDASDTALLEMGSSSNISSQAVTFGSLTIGNTGTYKATSGTTTITGPVNAGWLVNQQDGGTFTHNNGELDINAGANSGHLRVTSYDLKISMTGSNRVIWRDISGNVMTVANDLTIVQGGFDRDNLTDNLTVTGDVVIEDGGKIGDQNGSGVETGDNTFKSLTINSGGIYDATSGTTTVTGESSSGVNLSNSGTFTHNQGTVKVTCATQTSLVGFNGTNGFYNYTFAGTGSGQDQVCGGNTDFFGQVIIDSANSEVQMQSHTFNLYGGITIKQGGWDIGSSDTSGTVNVYGSVRNVGGTVVAS